MFYPVCCSRAVSLETWSLRFLCSLIHHSGSPSMEVHPLCLLRFDHEVICTCLFAQGRLHRELIFVWLHGDQQHVCSEKLEPFCTHVGATERIMNLVAWRIAGIDLGVPFLFYWFSHLKIFKKHWVVCILPFWLTNLRNTSEWRNFLCSWTRGKVCLTVIECCQRPPSQLWNLLTCNWNSRLLSWNLPLE